MAETKYGKYIMRPVKGPATQSGASAAMPVNLEGLKDWGGIQHRMKWSFISEPVLLVEAPHSHDFDEILGFYGCDPAHERDFGAEIELSLGSEGEKQVITTPSLVCIPKGLVHCPINFKSIGKPILFVRIYTAPEYVRKPVS
jgi:hypothetical protein